MNLEYGIEYFWFERGNYFVFLLVSARQLSKLDVDINQW